MSAGINEISKFMEIPLETEVTLKQDKTMKSLFSKSKSSDVSTNETRWTRGKIQKVKGVLDDDNKSSKKPSPVTNRRATRSVPKNEAADIKTDAAKQLSVDELPTRENNKKR
ncbi:hypothetical protein Hanom_Chr01g00054041 [Helianthus anomalus]